MFAGYLLACSRIFLWYTRWYIVAINADRSFFPVKLLLVLLQTSPCFQKIMFISDVLVAAKEFFHENVRDTESLSAT